MPFSKINSYQISVTAWDVFEQQEMNVSVC